MEIQISPMLISDLEEISPILLTDFDDFWTVSTLALEITNPNCHYLVARLGEEIVGFGGIFQIMDEIHLNNIVVKKANRNLGIGSILLQQLIALSQTKQAKSITLEVNEKNKYAISLYEKAGFITVGRRKQYYFHQDDAILMTLYFKE